MKYINKLTKKQESLLLKKLSFRMRDNGFLRGSEKIINNDSIAFHTWDHNYRNPIDYDEDCMYIGDFEVKCHFCEDLNTVILRKYLYSIFGEEYKNDLCVFLNKKQEAVYESAAKAAKRIEEEIKSL